ncbi:hypothetical protein M407DRAFT_164669 [Tulasnella calospora MUT 4182]|uniref:Uncharacterized protein n=1 Tax=Tulasnella calospora MUT 4182 TaxID=1051891 RepID=A0A0C3M7J2_9AGAM|nr:hypothetical protein M407DRAFT_164669 [Tulasnella calospora MUT 4182]
MDSPKKQQVGNKESIKQNMKCSFGSVTAQIPKAKNASHLRRRVAPHLSLPGPGPRSHLPISRILRLSIRFGLGAIILGLGRVG